VQRYSPEFVKRWNHFGTPVGQAWRVGETHLKVRAPHAVTLGGYATSHRAVREMKTDGVLLEGTKVRSSKYLNNLIEQGQRNVKFRTDVMLGFKRFGNAVSTLAGIGLIHRVRKGQFDLAKLLLKDTTTPAVWNAVLAA
jgi:transposase-like protein